MPMNTSRQLKQLQPRLVLEYFLLHNGSGELPVHINMVRTKPDLYDFSEKDIP
jgi:hypothetical protein